MVYIKKVLHVVDSLSMGGLETVAVNYFKYIDREKYDFTYLVFGEQIGEYEGVIRKLGGTVVHINPPSHNYLSYIKNLRRIIRMYGPFDIVHSHPLFNSGFVMKAAYLEGVPIRIAHSHSDRRNLSQSLIKKVYMKYARTLLLKYSSHFLACSELAGGYLFGVDYFKENGIIVPNSIDIDKFTFNKSIRKKTREKLGLKNKFVIGHTGALNEVKNQVFLLEILKEYLTINPNTKLMLVGDGPKKEYLLEQAKVMNLKQNVMFLGKRDDIPELLMAMDIFMFPSFFEGLGISVIEAQSVGLPGIISEHIPEEAIINENMLQKPLVIKEWLNAIQESNLNIQTTNDVKSRYSIEIMMEVIMSIYE